MKAPVPRLNIKTLFPRYGDSYAEDKTVVGPFCLVHPGVRDKRRVSEIDSSQPRHETAFWWRRNGPVTSQLTVPIKWPNHPLKLIGIYVHKYTQQRIPDTKLSQIHICTTVFDIFVYIYMVWVLMDGIPDFASQTTVTTSP